MSGTKGDSVGKEFHDMTEKEKIWHLMSRVEALERITARPSEPKKRSLAQVIQWIYSDAEARGADIPFKEMAQGAISHVLGVVESLPTMKDMGVEYYSKSELIKKLKEEGEG